MNSLGSFELVIFVFVILIIARSMNFHNKNTADILRIIPLLQMGTLTFFIIYFCFKSSYRAFFDAADIAIFDTYIKEISLIVPMPVIISIFFLVLRQYESDEGYHCCPELFVLISLQTTCLLFCLKTYLKWHQRMLQEKEGLSIGCYL